MKFRTLFFAAALLPGMIAAIRIMLLARAEESLPLFPATVERDCAPWDGPAFTLSIPIEEGMLQISIYRSPDIQHPVRFTFPDAGKQEGHVQLLLPVDVSEALTGNVFLRPAAQGVPLTGQFDLSTDEGQRLQGAFRAEWENEIVYCG